MCALCVCLRTWTIRHAARRAGSHSSDFDRAFPQIDVSGWTRLTPMRVANWNCTRPHLKNKSVGGSILPQTLWVDILHTTRNSEWADPSYSHPCALIYHWAFLLQNAINAHSVKNPPGGWQTWGPGGGERKLRFIWAWKHHGIWTCWRQSVLSLRGTAIFLWGWKWNTFDKICKEHQRAYFYNLQL